ncbi:MFS transporter [Caldivirga sp. MU80]|uniref:MFS transporter n=1 Tax=Caldivirga sp. MU80 TaxID=1650354 RepID=UPI0012E97E3A|nr:MFS transporter [Caldivirga sp. MU80]
MGACVMRRGFIIVQGLLPMMLISVYQYSWNLLMKPLMNSLNVNLPVIQVSYSLFVLFSTISQVLGGYIADSRGPRLIGVIGGALAGLGIITASMVSNIAQFYILWSIGSIGVGFVYGVSINLGVKWFSGSRGLATGLINMGFGIGASLFNPAISILISRGEYKFSMVLLGVLMLIVIMPLMATAKYPPTSTKRIRFSEIPPGFWLILASFSLMGIPLQLASSSLSVIGEGYGYLIVAAASSLLPLFSGIGRPIIGSISDKLGRRRTILAVGLVLTVFTMILAIRSPIAYITSTVAIGILGGSLITLFASLIGDEYGIGSSTFLFGILYNGKFVSALIGSVAFAESVEFIKVGGSLILESALTLLSMLPFVLFMRTTSSRVNYLENA